MKKGFTLIEIMMVVGIVSIIALMMYSFWWKEYLAKARDATRISYLSKVMTALRSYEVEYKTYPEPPTATGNCLSTFEWGITDYGFINLIGESMSRDPSPLRTVNMCQIPSVYWYKVITNLEVDDNEMAFLIVADVESNKNGNYIYGSSFSGVTDLSEFTLQNQWSIGLEVPDPLAVFVMTPESHNTLK